MLTKVKFKNFRSFKEETTIDLRRTNYKSLMETNVVGDVLKGVLLVGANASGKSNAILSLKMLLDLLFKDKGLDSDLYLCLFSDSHEYSVEYEFEISDNVIRYSISNDVSKDFLTEKLYIDDKIMLERMGLSAKSYLTLKDGVKYGEDEVNSEILFLRTLFFNTRFAGNEIMMKWFEFLQNSVYFNAYDRSIKSYGKKSLAVLKYVQENGVEKLNDFLEKYKFDYKIELEEEVVNKKVIFKMDKEDEKEIFFKRSSVNMSLPGKFESLGNRTLINMLPAVINAAEGYGMLIIDEFSSGFHNDLEELIIKYFMTNSKKSQLILVSHSTNLLSNSLLRPDQIYSVQLKDERGSKLLRFSDENPRQAQNLEKMYLSGVFEGLPEYEI